MQLHALSVMKTLIDAMTPLVHAAQSMLSKQPPKKTQNSLEPSVMKNALTKPCVENGETLLSVDPVILILNALALK